LCLFSVCETIFGTATGDSRMAACACAVGKSSDVYKSLPLQSVP
jgi:hypothetical protein